MSIAMPAMQFKRSLTIDQVVEATGYGKSTIKLAIKRGELRTKYANSTPVVRVVDLDEWLESLPEDPPNKRR